MIIIPESCVIMDSKIDLIDPKYLKRKNGTILAFESKVLIVFPLNYFF